MFFFFKQKTAYEMRISDWSSDVCSSDLCFRGCRATSCNTFPEMLHGRLGVDPVLEAGEWARCSPGTCRSGVWGVHVSNNEPPGSRRAGSRYGDEFPSDNIAGAIGRAGNVTPVSPHQIGRAHV